MARGNQKSSASLRVSTREDAPFAGFEAKAAAELKRFSDYEMKNGRPIPVPALPVKEMAELVEAEGKNSPLFKDTVKFLKALEKYTASDYQYEPGHKKTRGEMVKAFLALPPALQRSLSSDDSVEQYLLRGGDHAVRKDSSGMINASFTTKAKTALAFGEVLYTNLDMKSHGPIIDVVRVVQFADDLKLYTHNFQNDLSKEAEHIVTNVKWNKGVDKSKEWWAEQTKFKAEMEDRYGPMKRKPD